MQYYIRSPRQKYKFIVDYFTQSFKFSFAGSFGDYASLFKAYVRALLVKGVVDNSQYLLLLQKLEEFVASEGAYYNLHYVPFAYMNRKFLKLLFASADNAQDALTQEADKEPVSVLTSRLEGMKDDIKDLDRFFSEQYFSKNSSFLQHLLSSFSDYLAKRQPSNMTPQKYHAMLKKYLGTLEFLKVINRAQLRFLLRYLAEQSIRQCPSLPFNVSKHISDVQFHIQDIQAKDPLYGILTQSKLRLDSGMLDTPDQLIQYLTNAFQADVFKKQMSYSDDAPTGIIQALNEAKQDKRMGLSGIVDLFLENNFPSFDAYKLVLSSFFVFSESLAIDVSQLLVKAFDNYAIELVDLCFMPSALADVIHDDLTQLYQYNVNKESLAHSGLLRVSEINRVLESFPFHKPSRQLLQTLKQQLGDSGSSQQSATTIRGFIAQQSNKGDSHVRLVSLPQQGNINWRFLADETSVNSQAQGVLKLQPNMFLQKDQWGSRLLAKLKEFPNLTKPLVMEFHTKTLQRLFQPTATIKRMSNVHAILSRYVEDVSMLGLAKQKEKEFLITFLLRLMLETQVMKGCFNFKLGFAKLEDNRVFLDNKMIKAFAKLETDKKPAFKQIQLFHVLFGKIKDDLLPNRPRFSLRAFLKANYRYKAIYAKFNYFFKKMRDKLIPRRRTTYSAFAKFWMHEAKQISSHEHSIALFGRIRDQQLIDPGFRFAFIECFAENFSGIDYGSWKAFHSGMIDYLNNLVNIELNSAQKVKVKRAIAHLRPFFDKGNLDFSRLFAGFNELYDVQVDDSLHVNCIEDVMRSQVLDQAQKVAVVNAYVQDIVQSLYPQPTADKIKAALDALTQNEELLSPGYGLKNANANLLDKLKVNAITLNENEQEAIIKLLVAPFDEVLKLKRLMMTGRRYFASNVAQIADYCSSFLNLIKSLLDGESLSDLQATLQQLKQPQFEHMPVDGLLDYTADQLEKQDGLYKRLLTPTAEGNASYNEATMKAKFARGYTLFRNLLQRFTQRIFYVKPLTTIKLSSEIAPKMNFCYRSKEKLNIMITKIRQHKFWLNERDKTLAKIMFPGLDNSQQQQSNIKAFLGRLKDARLPVKSSIVLLFLNSFYKFFNGFCFANAEQIKTVLEKLSGIWQESIESLSKIFKRSNPKFFEQLVGVLYDERFFNPQQMTYDFDKIFDQLNVQLFQNQLHRQAVDKSDNDNYKQLFYGTEVTPEKLQDQASLKEEIKGFVQQGDFQVKFTELFDYYKDRVTVAQAIEKQMQGLADLQIDNCVLKATYVKLYQTRSAAKQMQSLNDKLGAQTFHKMMFNYFLQAEDKRLRYDASINTIDQPGFVSIVDLGEPVSSKRTQLLAGDQFIAKKLEYSDTYDRLNSLQSFQEYTQGLSCKRSQYHILLEDIKRRMGYHSGNELQAERSSAQFVSSKRKVLKPFLAATSKVGRYHNISQLLARFQKHGFISSKRKYIKALLLEKIGRLNVHVYQPKLAQESARLAGDVSTKRTRLADFLVTLSKRLKYLRQNNHKLGQESARLAGGVSPKRTKLKVVFDSVAKRSSYLGAGNKLEAVNKLKFASFVRKRLNHFGLEKAKLKQWLQGAMNQNMLRKIDQSFESSRTILKASTKGFMSSEYAMTLKDLIQKDLFLPVKDMFNSSKYLYKMVSVLREDDHFLKYVKEALGPIEAQRLIEAMGHSSRYKYKALLSLMGKTVKKTTDTDPRVKKLRAFMGDFRRYYAQKGEFELKEAYAVFMKQMAKLLKEQAKLSQMGKEWLPKPQGPSKQVGGGYIVCCCCCCQARHRPAQRVKLSPAEFLEDAAKMINVDPTVKLSINVKNDMGGFDEKRFFIFSESDRPMSSAELAALRQEEEEAQRGDRALGLAGRGQFDANDKLI